ncbi:MAG: hypothetical protein ACQGVC_18565 [Myxococcota bacterium]
MTIQDWGAIGEVVSAVAVVVTLAYLATQIRYARLAAADVSRQNRAEGVRDLLLAGVANPAYARAWTKADPEGRERMRTLEERFGLTTEEAEHVWNGACAWTFLHWAQFRSMKTPEDERELHNLIAAFYSREPMRTYWNDIPYSKQILDPDFVAWVDQVLAETREG